MEIITYWEKYRQQIIDLILHIQNDETKISLTLDEQPDLMDIDLYYRKSGGEFWVAVEDGSVVGTVALMCKGSGNGILKKFFVRKDYRGQKVGYALYCRLIEFARKNNIHTIILDTPSVAHDSHRFYERAGFMRISRDELPFEYDYPDRNSYLYMLNLCDTEMNLETLCKSYDLHDSVVEEFSYFFEKRCAVLALSLGDWQNKKNCIIKFNDITFFKFESDNVDFAENELIDIKVSGGEDEYFKAFFSEGFMKAGKTVEIKCDYIEIKIS
ncbi:MAG: GNAT family N-acetyltransferase [Ruminococcus flavefaciens]|nr:GNAT family N-acetyltransferase [Ruminococcus flavefaciens]